MGRPKKKIDPEMVKKLGAIQCSMAEIGAILGCSVDLLERRFADVIKEARDYGKASLKRAMYNKALGGNVVAQIWLSKNYLNFRDKSDITTDGEKLKEQTIQINVVNPETALNIQKLTGQ